MLSMSAIRSKLRTTRLPSERKRCSSNSRPRDLKNGTDQRPSRGRSAAITGRRTRQLVMMLLLGKARGARRAAGSFGWGSGPAAADKPAAKPAKKKGKKIESRDEFVEKGVA